MTLLTSMPTKTSQRVFILFIMEKGKLEKAMEKALKRQETLIGILFYENK